MATLTHEQRVANASDWLGMSDPSFRAGELVDRQQLKGQLQCTGADDEDVESIAALIEAMA